MARPKGSFTRTPKLRRHATGQAIVTLVGRDVYLGTYGTPAAEQKYRAVVGQWLLAGRAAADPTIADDLTVDEVLSAWMMHLQQTRLGDRSRDTNKAMYPQQRRRRLSILRSLYGESAARAFGPLRLRTYRQAMIDFRDDRKGRVGRALCRKTVNDAVSDVKLMFKWAASMELVPSSVFEALRTVEHLAYNTVGVRETTPVCPADVAMVDAVLGIAPPTVAAMIRLQMGTAARPNEVCIIRTGDIDMTGEVWKYTPHFHKTDRKGFDRTIYIAAALQDTIRPFLRLDPTAYLFTPLAVHKEAIEERRKKYTPKRLKQLEWQTNKAEELRRQHAAGRTKPMKFSPRLNNGTYAQVIARLCKAVNTARIEAGETPLPEFRPNQLRHLAATRARAIFDLDTASAILGHSNVTTTQIYAKRNNDTAMNAIARLG